MTEEIKKELQSVYDKLDELQETKEAQASEKLMWLIGEIMGDVDNIIWDDSDSHKFKVILEQGNYALIERGQQLKEYAVVYGLNKESKEWAHTCCCVPFEYNGSSEEYDRARALAFTLDYFREKTDESYISAKKIKGLLESALEKIEEDLSISDFLDDMHDKISESEEEMLLKLIKGGVFHDPRR